MLALILKIRLGVFVVNIWILIINVVKSEVIQNFHLGFGIDFLIISFRKIFRSLILGDDILIIIYLIIWHRYTLYIFSSRWMTWKFNIWRLTDQITEIILITAWILIYCVAMCSRWSLQIFWMQRHRLFNLIMVLSWAYRHRINRRTLPIYIILSLRVEWIIMKFLSIWWGKIWWRIS